jgi:hypothetical protein
MEGECLVAALRAPLEENFDLFASFPSLRRRLFSSRRQLQSAGRLHSPWSAVPRRADLFKPALKSMHLIQDDAVRDERQKYDRADQYKQEQK